MFPPFKLFLELYCILNGVTFEIFNVGEMGASCHRGIVTVLFTQVPIEESPFDVNFAIHLGQLDELTNAVKFIR